SGSAAVAVGSRGGGLAGGGYCEAVTPPPAVEPGVRGIASLEDAGNGDGVFPVPTAAGRSPGDRHAEPVVAGDEVGELPDEVDGLLRPESPALPSGDRVVDGLTGDRVVDEVARTVDPRLLVRAGVGVALGGVLDAGEEPELVLDDVPGQRRAQVPDVVEVARAEDGRGAAGDGQRALRAGEASRCPGAEDRAVELVTAGFGGRAQRAAEGPSVLGHV